MINDGLALRQTRAAQQLISYECQTESAFGKRPMPYDVKMLDAIAPRLSSTQELSLVVPPFEEEQQEVGTNFCYFLLNLRTFSHCYNLVYLFTIIICKGVALLVFSDL